ncbi:MAG: tetratricopeptide repeat protein [Rhodospirillales bacterium]|nr:tetratricopeptide repeat protein [Rhodospirillales bacterium]
MTSAEPGDVEFAIGVDHQRNGRLEQAAGAYSAAISVNNRHAKAIHNLGTVMLTFGDQERALGLLQMATKIDPQYTEAFVNWGIALKETGDPTAAITRLEQAVSLDSSQLLVQVRLADLYREQEMYDKAIAAYEGVLASNPDLLEANNNLGVALRRLGRHQEALTCFDRALAVNPDFVDSLVNSANCLGDLGLDELAIERLNRARALNPELGATHNNLGIALAKVGRFDEALACYETAISLSADPDEVMNNMGAALNSSGRSQEAIETFNQVLARNANHYAALNNMGSALKDMARFDASAEKFRESIKIKPDYAEAHANLGYMLLMRGQFEEGWPEYGWRGRIPGSVLARRSYDKPAWQDQDLSGKSIYVYPEQGLGDIVQFARYATLLKGLGARVIMEIPSQLVDLFRGLQGVDSFNLQGTPPPDFDFHVSIMDLPQQFATTLETIPGEAGYVTVDPAIEQAWAARLASDTGFRVGLVWAGNPNHTNDHNRSLKLEQLRPLVEIPGLSAYSLQVGKTGEAKALFGDRITDLAPQLTSFAETAGAMSCVDLVISVDTSPLHVAGALACPAWGLIPYIPDWRWLLDRDDSPWYPTMRLFRQDADKTWEPVIAEVVAAVKSQMGNR